MSVHRFFANKDNLLTGKTPVASSVKPAANTVRKLATSGSGDDGEWQGNGRVTVSGAYTGAEDIADLRVRVAAGSGTAMRRSAVTFTGSGNGQISDIAIAPGTAAQSYEIQLADLGTDDRAAAAEFFGVTLRARATGSGGNNIRLTVSTAGLTYTATGNTLIDELPAGSNGQPTRLIGEQWRFSADIYPLSPEGELHPSTARLAFGDSPLVHRMWSAREAGETVFYVDPPPPKALPEGTAVYAVTGTYAVTITDGVTPENIIGVTTLYSLLQAIGRQSNHITVDGVVTEDRTPGGMAVEDLALRTGAYATESSGAGSEYAQGLTDISVPTDAPTQTVTAECVEQPLAGAEQWAVSGTSIGNIGYAQTAVPFTHAAIEFTIPPRFRSGEVAFDLVSMSRAGTGDPPALSDILCIDQRYLGVNATSQELTLRYRIPEALPCGVCTDATITGAFVPEYLGLDSLPPGAVARDFDKELADSLTACSTPATGGQTWVVPYHQAGIYENVGAGTEDYFLFGEAFQPYFNPTENNVTASTRAAALFSTQAAAEAFQAAYVAKFAPTFSNKPTNDLKAIGFTVADLEQTISGIVINWGKIIPNHTIQQAITANRSELVAVALAADTTYLVAKVPTAVPYGGFPDFHGWPAWLATTPDVDDRITAAIPGFFDMPIFGAAKAEFDRYQTLAPALADAVNVMLSERYRGAFWVSDQTAINQPLWDIKGGDVYDFRADDYVAATLLYVPFRAVITEAAGHLATAKKYQAVMTPWLTLWNHILADLTILSADQKNASNVRNLYAAEFTAVAAAIAGIVPPDVALWEDWDGPYWEVISDRGSAPAYKKAKTNRWYHACYPDPNGVVIPSQEFAFLIQVAESCISYLTDGSEVKLRIAGREGYRVGDRLIVDTIAASPFYLLNGRTGNNTHLWTVRGSVDGLMDEYTNILGAESIYNDGGLQFKIVRGAIPFSLGAAFRFASESGRWEYSIDGGDMWSTAADIADGDLALVSGLTVRFEQGASPSFVSGDTARFQVLQPYSPAHVLMPDQEVWQWPDSSASVTFDLEEDTLITAVGYPRHRLPASAVQTVEGLSAADAVLWTETLPYRRGPMLIEFTVARTARKLRYSVASATGGSISWLFAGAGVQTEFPLTACRKVYTSAWATGGGLNPARRLQGRGFGYTIEWQRLSQADWEALQALLDSLADSNSLQQPVVFVPSHLYPEDAALVTIESDNITVDDYMCYGTRYKANRKLSLSLTLTAVIG